MNVICSILNNNISKNVDNIIDISLIENNNVLCSQQCKQNIFCEQLPVMINNIFIFLKKKYDKNCINNIKYETNFKAEDSLTTYRIFKSFTQGMLIKKM